MISTRKIYLNNVKRPKIETIFKISQVKATAHHNAQTIITFNSMCHRVVKQFFVCSFSETKLELCFFRISLKSWEQEGDCLIVVEIYHNPLFKIFYFGQRGLGNI